MRPFGCSAARLLGHGLSSLFERIGEHELEQLHVGVSPYGKICITSTTTGYYAEQKKERETDPGKPGRERKEGEGPATAGQGGDRSAPA